MYHWFESQSSYKRRVSKQTERIISISKLSQCLTMSKAPITLTGPKNQDDQIALIRTKAKHIWKYINYKDNNPPTLIGPIPSKLVKIIPNATNIIGFTPNQLSLYQALQYDHRLEKEAYITKLNHLDELRLYIQLSILRQNFIYTRECETLYKILVELLKRNTLIDRARKLELKNQYQTLKKSPKN